MKEWLGRFPAQRPLCWAAAGAVCAIFGSALAFCHGFALGKLALAVALFCGLFRLTLPRGRRNGLLLCLSFVGLGTAFFGFWRLVRAEPQLAFSGWSGTMECMALEEAQGKGSYGQVQVRALALGEEEVNFSLPLYLEDASPEIKAGEHFAVEVRLSRAPLEPWRGFSSEGMFLQASQTGELQTQDGETPWWLRLQGLSQQVAKVAGKWLPQRESALLTGIITGNKEDFTAQQKRDLNLSGTAHLAAVSGLHVSSLLGVAFALFGKKGGSLVGIPLCLMMVVLAGGTPSVLRAVIMAFFAMAAFWMGREKDTLSSLSAALLLLLLFSPMSVLNVGLQLSFASVLGIGLLFPPMQQAIREKLGGKHRLLEKILEGMAVTLAAQAFTLPISVLVFQRVSLLALFSNLLIVPLLAPVLVQGLCFVVAGSFWPILGKMLSLALHPLLWWIDLVQRKTAALPFSSVSSGGVMLFFSLLGLGVALFFFRKKEGVGRGLATYFLCGFVCLSGVGMEQALTLSLSVVNCGGSGLLLVGEAGQLTAFSAGDLKGDDFYRGAQDTLDRMGLAQVSHLWLTSTEGIAPIAPPEDRWAGVQRVIAPKGVLSSLMLGEEKQVYGEGGGFSFSSGEGALIPGEKGYLLQLALPSCTVLATCGQDMGEVLTAVKEQDLQCEVLLVDQKAAEDLPRLAAICRRTGCQMLVCTRSSYGGESASLGAAFSGPVLYLEDGERMDMELWAAGAAGEDEE